MIDFMVDPHVHNAWNNADACILDRNNERRSIGVGAAGSIEKLGVVVRYETSNNCQTDHVELELSVVKLQFSRVSLTNVIRQNTCLTAVGSATLGFSVSAAVRPTSSVPPKEKAAVTKTEHNPLKP